jgi:hypothetical protein
MSRRSGVGRPAPPEVKFASDLGAGLLGLRRKPVAASAHRITADLTDAVISGQVAIGERIVQIHAEHGAVVNYFAPDERPVVRPRPAPVRRLPRDFLQLVGRDRELALASTTLLAPAAPLEFTGPAGIGKSVLLRRLAHRIAGESPEPVFFTWCGAQPVSDLQQSIFECLYDFEGQIVPRRRPSPATSRTSAP